MKIKLRLLTSKIGFNDQDAVFFRELWRR